MSENTNSTANNSSDDSQWVKCPSGEISGMVDRVCRQRRTAVVTKASAVATLLLLGTGVWLFSLPVGQVAEAPDGEFQYGSICCSDVMSYAAAFHQGELDEKTTTQISQHISECPHCGPAFEKMESEPHAADSRKFGRSHSVMLADSL